MADDLILSTEEQERYEKDWQPLEYGPDIFLKWHKISRSKISGLEKLPTRNIVDQDDDHIYLDVKFAETWWEASRYDPYDALRWYSAGFKPGQVENFKALGFRSPNTVSRYYLELGDKVFVKLVKQGVKFPKSGTFDENVIEARNLAGVPQPDPVEPEPVLESESDSEEIDSSVSEVPESSDITEEPAPEPVQDEPINNDQPTSDPEPESPVEETVQLKSVHSSELVRPPKNGGVVVMYGQTTHNITLSSVTDVAKAVIAIPFKLVFAVGKRVLQAF